RGDQAIAEGVLLPEELRVAARGRRVPGPPLVHDQADPPLRVEAIQDRPLLEDEPLNAGGFLQQLVPLVVAVLGRGAGGAAVKMSGPAVDAPVAAHGGEEAAGPVRVVAVRAAGNEVERRAGEIAQVGAEAAI